MGVFEIDLSGQFNKDFLKYKKLQSFIIDTKKIMILYKITNKCNDITKLSLIVRFDNSEIRRRNSDPLEFHNF